MRKEAEITEANHYSPRLQNWQDMYSTSSEEKTGDSVRNVCVRVGLHTHTHTPRHTRKRRREEGVSSDKKRDAHF